MIRGIISDMFKLSASQVCQMLKGKKIEGMRRFQGGRNNSDG